MDEDSNEIKPAHVSSYRSPCFTREEEKCLLKLIEKYKVIILNKSTTAAVSQAKEVAWLKIAKVFNSQGFRHARGAECLKTKWENLKRNAKKVSKNLMDAKYDEFSDLTNQVVTLMHEADMSSNIMDVPQEVEEDLKEAIVEQKEENQDNISNNLEKTVQSDESGDEIEIRNRSLNFSPQESSLLLKCVKEERRLILSRENTGKAIQLKNRAWLRITEAFNKKSPQKRSTRVLRTKFHNLKRNAKSGYFKKYFKRHEKLEEEDSKEIKAEPRFEYEPDSDEDREDNNCVVDDDDCANDVLPDSAIHYPDAAPDPLSTVLSSDSGLGSTSFIGAYNFSNNEVTKLKLELLNYQLETAKLERQRLQEAMKAEAAARESMAVERALRLRAARLVAVTAETKLPATHEALQYTFEEARAREYMNQH
ncbi:uncharacterized protein [Epargyreus clarus]|uniref:uncharacterized protein isoform X2 n=1 Tax=Epargyreus clarus TaxID=520877 RepID=UPI003C2BB884